MTDSRLKVQFLISSLNSGGAERVLSQLVSGLDPQRFLPQVVTFAGLGMYGPILRSAGIDVRDLGMSRHLPTPGSAWNLLRIAREFRPDVLCGWMQHGNLAATMLKHLLPGQPKLIWNVRQAVYSFDFEKRSAVLLIKLLRRLSSFPDAIICNSAIAVEQLKKLHYDMRNARVVPNGFNTKLFCPDPQARLRLRAELGLPQEAILIGRIGRNDSMKDNATFLRSMVAVLKNHPSAHAIMAGDGIAPERDPLASELAPHRSALAGRLHLLGERNDVPMITAALDVAVSSSFTEGFPNVVGEAMACGIPCIATDVGDSAALIANEGVLIPARDSDALIAACESLLTLPPSDRVAFGRRGQDRISAHFSIERMIGRFQSLLQPEAPPAFANDTAHPAL